MLVVRDKIIGERNELLAKDMEHFAAMPVFWLVRTLDSFLVRAFHYLTSSFEIHPGITVEFICFFLIKNRETSADGA